MKLALLSLLFALPVFSSDLIDPARIITWKGNVGIPGGIPNSSNMTTYVNVTAGNMNTSYLQTQIDNCPSNQVIQLPSGTYSIGTMNFGLNHGVVVRGAGMGQTILTGSHVYMGQAGGTPTAPTVTSGSTKGSTSVVVSSASGFRLNDFMILEGGDDPDIVILPGTEDSGPGQPCQKFICQITNISGTTISFTPPLPYKMLTTGAYNGQALKANIYNNGGATPNFLARAGLENMTLRLDPAWDYGVDLHSVAYCWLKNVEVYNSGQRCIYLQRAYKCEVNGCFMHDSTYSGPYGYGVTLEPASACLVANNISSNMTGSFQVNEGSSGNVFAYNYVPKSKYTNPLYTQPDFQDHTGTPVMNLWEGNYGFMAYFDDIHGSSAYHTVFRNRLVGWQNNTIQYQQYCVAVAIHNKYVNVVGNVLGDVAGGTTHMLTYERYGDGNLAIIALDVDGTGTDARGTVQIHGNWDSVQNQITWDARNSTNMSRTIPDSLFLTSKPDWWGNLAWPPFSISNITAAAMSPTNIPAGYRGIYGVDPPAGAGTNPPAILNQPSSQTNIVGGSVTFTVIATNAAMYQWSLRGTNYPGATSSSWTTPASTLADNGSSVFITIANPLGTTNSSVVTWGVTNGPLPVITVQPVGMNVLVGNAAVFAVTATSTGTTNYQWKTNGVSVSGATARTWTTPAYAIGSYTVTVGVSNQYGGLLSTPVTLAITNGVLSISTPPQSVTCGPGSNATFTVTAAGNAPLSYQWRLNGASIASATLSSYTTNAVNFRGNGAQYSVRVTNAYSALTSSVAILTITNINPPTVTVNPQSQTVTNATSFTLTVAGSGSGTLAYQWRKGGTNISGATATAYTKASCTTNDAGSYTAVVTNAYGSATSAVATIIVVSGGTAPAITLNPVSQSVGTGGNVTFTVAASGSAPLTYQWLFNGANITGATASSYTVAPAVGPNGGNYRARVSNAYGSVYSADAVLQVINTIITPNVPTQLFLVRPYAP